MYPLVIVYGALLAFTSLGLLRSLLDKGPASTPKSTTIHFGRNALWLGVVVAAAIYLYYVTAFLVGALAIIGAVASGLRGRVVAWLAPFGLGLIAWVPWLYFLSNDGIASGLGGIPEADQTHPTVAQLSIDTWLAFVQGFERPGRLATIIAVIILVFTIIGLREGARWRFASGFALGFCLIAALVGLYVLTLARPFYYPRFALFVLPIVAALFSAGFIRVMRWTRVQAHWVAAPIIILACLPSLLATYRAERTGYSPADFLAVIATLRESSRADDTLVAGHRLRPVKWCRSVVASRYD